MPFDKYDAEFVFSNNKKAEGYVLAVYNGLPFAASNNNGYARVDGALLACATDEATISSPGSSIIYLTEGSLTPRKTNPDGCWSDNYKFIRDANIGLEDLEYLSSNYAALKVQLKAELKFLKAYYYFELVKRYGGVPIVDSAVKLSEDTNIPRSTFAECISYITGLLDEAYPDLPENNVVTFGRASKGAAMALKARVLLYAASPLYNGNGYDGSGNEFICYGNTDPARWAAAAEAAAAVIKMGDYELYAPTVITDASTDAQVISAGTKNYRDLFITIVGNKELIMSRTSAKGNKVEVQGFPYGIPNATGITSPSQQMVDAYGMVNGKAIDAPGSTYSETDPYTGRDPRFYASIFYNGQLWNGTTTVETFTGGAHNNAANATKTGYYLSKFCSEKVIISGNTTNTDHCFPLFRYAEVLLNYAEAANEAYGPDTDHDACGLTARQAVELVRARVLRPADAAVTAADAAALRTVIRDERRVELAFEDHRYFDLKRWMTAETVLNEDIKGMQVTKTGTSFNYKVVSNVAVRQFTPKFYIYPIPNSEVVNNTAIKRNNPLW